MESIFEALPGLETPVDSISKSLASMWEDTAAQGGAAPASDDAKATQINFILHLGGGTTAADAVEQFHTAVLFSRRYPCRVVVLCPLLDGNDHREMRAKVYGECSLGKSKDDKRCCEFVMLSYPVAMRRFLESQVSVCLSTDLPLYYWAHRFKDNAILAGYGYFLSTAKRVLIDSSIAPPDTIGYPWPKPETVRDLVHARLLPVRQSIGQFLSRYGPSTLVDGLVEVCASHGAARQPEARVLLDWAKGRLVKCGAGPFGLRQFPDEGACKDMLSLRFQYSSGKAFLWTAGLDHGHAIFEADFGTGKTVLSAAVSVLSPESALSEAVFF